MGEDVDLEAMKVVRALNGDAWWNARDEVEEGSWRRVVVMVKGRRSTDAIVTDYWRRMMMRIQNDDGDGEI